MGKTPSPSNKLCRQPRNLKTSLKLRQAPASRCVWAAVTPLLRISVVISGFCGLARRTMADTKGIFKGCSTTLDMD